MDLLKNFPKKWYVTLDDFNEVELKLATKFRKKINTNPSYNGSYLLSYHVLTNLTNDGSFFEYACSFNFIEQRKRNPNAVKLTKKQFLELISETPNTMIDKNKTINIGYDLLKEYYEGSTEKQKEHINKHFTIDGTTTIGAIIELHDMLVCKGWKEKIKAKHPECFEDDKYFDLSELYDKGFNRISDDVNDTLLKIDLYNQVGKVRVGGKYKHKGIVLDLCRPARANWEIVDDGNFILAVPTKIKK